MATQLTFDLPVKVSRDRGDFFVSSANALAVARLDDTGGWAQCKLALAGPEGAGKSHLAHVWAEAEGGAVLKLDSLTGLDIAGLATPLAVDVTNLPADSATEEALFHLHNHMQSQGLALMLVARDAPSRWPIALPDLKSRMAATDVVEIDAPDDALLAAVLVKLFADRQLNVPLSVVQYLTRHMERSFAAAQRVVAVLDDLALTECRDITRTLAQRVLDNLPTDAQ